MPTYEYRCRQCGERMEVFQKFSEKPLRVHPECGGDLQKVFHPSGIVFKGSGYYATDSRSKQSASSNGSNGSDDKKTDKKEKDDKASSDKSSSDKASSDKSSKSDSSSAAASD